MEARKEAEPGILILFDLSLGRVQGGMTCNMGARVFALRHINVRGMFFMLLMEEYISSSFYWVTLKEELRINKP